MRILNNLEEILQKEDGLYLSSILFGLGVRMTYEFWGSDYSFPLILASVGLGYGTLKSMIHAYYQDCEDFD
jgi:hypothetical protein